MTAQDCELARRESREDAVGHVHVCRDPDLHAALTALATSRPIRLTWSTAREPVPEKAALSIQKGTLYRKNRRVPTTRMSMSPLLTGSPRTPSPVRRTRKVATRRSDWATGAARKASMARHHVRA